MHEHRWKPRDTYAEQKKALYESVYGLKNTTPSFEEFVASRHSGPATLRDARDWQPESDKIGFKLPGWAGLWWPSSWWLSPHS